MKKSIGFVLVTHKKPKQIIRLICTINRIFDCPMIAIHHDFSKCDLNVNELTKNVLLVQPHLQTEWGTFTPVEAALLALELLYKDVNSPDWFVLLSGQDYPIKPAEKIMNDMVTSPFDVNINNELIQYNEYEWDWQRLCYARYCAVGLDIPFFTKKIKLTKRRIILNHPIFTMPL